jgi:hypothetical protein
MLEWSNRQKFSAKHDESIGENSMFRDLVGKPEGKRPLAIFKGMWKCSIKMYLTEIG